MSLQPILGHSLISLSSAQKSILSSLYQFGFCSRCQLRFAGVHLKSIYLNSQLDQQYTKTIDCQNGGSTMVLNENSPTFMNREPLTEFEQSQDQEMSQLHHSSSFKPKNCVCPACMGLLQRRYFDLGKQLVAKLSQEGFRGITNFLPSIKLPISLLLYQAACISFIKENFNLSQEKDQNEYILEVKDVLKMLIQEDMSVESHLKFDSKSGLFAEIEVADPPFEYEEFRFLKKIPKAKFNMKVKRKQDGEQIIQGLTIDKVKNAFKTLDLNDFEEYDKWPLKIPKNSWNLQLSACSSSSMFIGGRYTKLKRHISHSPWIVKKERLAEESVEELIIPEIHRFLKTEEHKFASSGREDADVLMLGEGRPFYFEIKNPKIFQPTKEELLEIQSVMNEHNKGKVQVSKLSVVSREQVKLMNDSVQTKEKTYKCLVRVFSQRQIQNSDLDEHINHIKNLPILQCNPTRVPRRADLERKKTIIGLCAHVASEAERNAFFESGIPKPAISSNKIPHLDLEHQYDIYLEKEAAVKDKCVRGPHNIEDLKCTDLVIELTTSAGTYVKEFIHGDGRRTRPSFISLLNVPRADVLALDVLRVHLDWPVYQESPIQSEE